MVFDRNVTCEDNCDRESRDMVYLAFFLYFLKLKVLEYKMSDAKILPFNFPMQKKLKFQLWGAPNDQSVIFL